MGIKYLYSVGDSFSYGEGLLDSVRHLPAMDKWKHYDLSTNGVAALYFKNRDGHDQLITIKDSLTIGGFLADGIGAKFFNYSQPGAAMDTIMFQMYLVLNDMKRNNYSPSECFVLVGMTSPLRKMHLGKLLSTCGPLDGPDSYHSAL